MMANSTKTKFKVGDTWKSLNLEFGLGGVSSKDGAEDPHPEDPRRLETIINCLDRSGLLHRMEELRTDHLLEKWEVELAHGDKMWTKLESYSKMTNREMRKWNEGEGDKLSLYAHATSFLCTRIGGGGVLALLKKIKAVGGSAMAIERPPCNVYIVEWC